MKRLITLILSLIFLFTFCGCTKQDKEASGGFDLQSEQEVHNSNIQGTYAKIFDANNGKVGYIYDDKAEELLKKYQEAELKNGKEYDNSINGNMFSVEIFNGETKKAGFTVISETAVKCEETVYEDLDKEVIKEIINFITENTDFETQ